MMGWKNVKEHYQIEHIVHVVEGEGLCIGSPCIYNLIVIAPDRIVAKHNFTSNNESLQRIFSEMEADPQLLRDLIERPDVFSAGIPVYTYDGGDIIEKKCEALGWPNVTHDGCLMHDNNFSTDRRKVVAWAKQNAISDINICRRSLDDINQRQRELLGLLSESVAALEKINALPDDVQDEK